MKKERNDESPWESLHVVCMYYSTKVNFIKEKHKLFDKFGYHNSIRHECSLSAKDLCNIFWLILWLPSRSFQPNLSNLVFILEVIRTNVEFISDKIGSILL